MAGILSRFSQRLSPQRRWLADAKKDWPRKLSRYWFGLSQQLSQGHFLWLLFELMALAGMVWLVCLQPALNGQPPTYELMLALVTTGALVHTLRRWLNSRRNPLVGTFSERARGVTWIAWLALAGTAWSHSLQFWWSALECWLPTQSTTHSEANFDSYLAAIGIVIAIVTAFYLLLLHRTADEGRRIIDELKGFQEELEQRRQVERHLGDGLEFLERDGQALRKDVLQPMSAVMVVLMSKAKIPADSAKKWLSALQAQQSALRLLLAEDPDQFVSRWDELKVYRENLRNQVSYLSDKALRHLGRLLKDRTGELEEAEIRRLKRELRDWGQGR